MIAPPRPGSPYLDRGYLAALVRHHRLAGGPSEDLGRALLLIAGGVWDRYRFTTDRDEYVGGAVVHLLGRPLAKADPALNLFSYFTTCCIRYGWKVRDQAAAERRRFHAYCLDRLRAGRVPDAAGG